MEQFFGGINNLVLSHTVKKVKIMYMHAVTAPCWSFHSFFLLILCSGERHGD